MDKWDELSERMQKAMLAEEPAAMILASLQFFAEFGRALELLGQDTDRLATATERLVEIAVKTAEPLAK